MNKETIKAMQGKKEHKVREWWRKNGYKVWRVVLFPLWMLALLKDKITAYLNSKQKWNEERANEILNYYIPRSAEWNEKEQCFYFFDNGLGWRLSLAKEYLKWKDRRFWEVNCSKIREYLIEKFQLEGFTKVTGNCYDWTEITFNLNKEGA